MLALMPNLVVPMNLALAVLCDEVRERGDGKLDVIGVFSELSAPGFPAVQGRMTVVFVMEWTRDEAGAQVFRADLVQDCGRRILTIEGETTVTRHTEGRPLPRTRVVLPLQNVVFPEAGAYHFELVAGGDVMRTCTLFVSQRTA
jgi:hypothetical protein